VTPKAEKRDREERYRIEPKIPNVEKLRFVE
jgi:hypothetical protein